MSLFSKGRILAFSGLDGAGKSTQINLVIQSLSGAKRKPVYLWVRGGYTPVFVWFKDVLRAFSRGKALPKPGQSDRRKSTFKNPHKRRLWILISIIDLILVYGIYLRFCVWRGRDIVCDRFLWDTAIDFELNFPEENVERWLTWRLLQSVTPTPDVSFLLLIPVSESMRRSKLKFEPFPDSPEVLEKRLERYRTLNYDKVEIIDCMRPIDQISTDIHLRIGLEKHRAAFSDTTDAH